MTKTTITLLGIAAALVGLSATATSDPTGQAVAAGDLLLHTAYVGAPAPGSYLVEPSDDKPICTGPYHHTLKPRYGPNGEQIGPTETCEHKLQDDPDTERHGDNCGDSACTHLSSVRLGASGVALPGGTAGGDPHGNPPPNPVAPPASRGSDAGGADVTHERFMAVSCQCHPSNGGLREGDCTSCGGEGAASGDVGSCSTCHGSGSCQKCLDDPMDPAAAKGDLTGSWRRRVPVISA
jgi:hypothetical protein